MLKKILCFDPCISTIFGSKFLVLKSRLIHRKIRYLQPWFILEVTDRIQRNYKTYLVMPEGVL